MTLAKYTVAVLLWALFYLICAFAIAVGFGIGWRLVGNGKPFTRPRFPQLKIPRREVGSNGNTAATPASPASATG